MAVKTQKYGIILYYSIQKFFHLFLQMYIKATYKI